MEVRKQVFIMKKTKLMYLGLGVTLMALSACNNSSDNARASSLAPQGEEADLATTIRKAQTASQSHMMSSSGFSFSLGTGASFYSETTEQEHHTNKANTDHNVKTVVDVSAPSLDVRTSGLTGTKAADVKISAKMGATAAVTKTTDGTEEKVLPSISISGASYLSNKVAYLDLSNKNIKTFINYIANDVLSLPSQYTILINLLATGKWSYTTPLTDDSMPLLQSDYFSDMKTVTEQWAKDADDYKDFLHAVKESDGSYSIYASLNKNDVITLATKSQEAADSSSTSTSSIDYASKFANLKVAELEFIVNFTDSKLNYAKTVVDISNQETGAELNTYAYDSTTQTIEKTNVGTVDTSMAYKFNFGVSFGNETPDIPSSFDGYTSIDSYFKSSSSGTGVSSLK
jgi:hypothetical protein